MIKQTGRVNLFTLMETYIRVSGKMMWLMVWELILMQKEPTILENGRMISRMVKGWRNGLMVQNMRGFLRKENDMGRENLNLSMVQSTRGISRKMIYMVMGNIHGETAKFTKDNGIIIKCMGRGNAYGLMGNPIMGSTLMIRKMVMVFLNGQMVKYMKGNGRMVNNMVLELSLILRVLEERDRGKKVNNFDSIFILIFFFFLPKYCNGKLFKLEIKLGLTE